MALGNTRQDNPFTNRELRIGNVSLRARVVDDVGFHCVEDTIARSTDAATKQHGGKQLVLIRLPSRENGISSGPSLMSERIKKLRTVAVKHLNKSMIPRDRT